MKCVERAQRICEQRMDGCATAGGGPDASVVLLENARTLALRPAEAV